MKKDRSASEGPRIDGLNIYDYKFREYLCLFDRKVDIPNRLRSLTIGLQLYSQYGFSRDQFIGFHKNKQLIMSTTMVAVIVLLIVVELLVLFKLPSWAGREVQYGFGTYLLAAFTAWFIFYSIRTASKNIRANFTHVNSALSSNTCLRAMQLASVQDQSLFKAIAEGVMDGDFGGKFMTHSSVTSLSNVAEQAGDAAIVSSRPGALMVGGNDAFAKKIAGISPDSDAQVFAEPIAVEQFKPSENDGSEFPTFQNQLIELSRQQNKFNDLPMTMVIDFFNVMCCPECKYKVPQMTEMDFIRFINAAFLGQTLDGKIKLSNSNNRKMLTREIFHQFMNASLSYLKLPQNGASEKYRRLLSDHFDGYEGKNTTDNFRTEINNRLEVIRNDYKDELRFLQWLQTPVKQ